MNEIHRSVDRIDDPGRCFGQLDVAFSEGCECLFADATRRCGTVQSLSAIEAGSEGGE